MNENLPGLYPLILDSGNCANKSRIKVNTPVYVAGLERGVLPIGFWFISMTLSTYSSPATLLYCSGYARDPFSSLDKIGYSVSLTRVLFPDPLTPVTTINFSRGNLVLMFFKLLPDASSK